MQDCPEKISSKTAIAGKMAPGGGSELQFANKNFFEAIADIAQTV